MNRIKTLFILVALAFVCACGNGQVEYLVSATGAEDGTRESLIDMISGDVQEAAEVTEGSVLFKGMADKDALLAVQKEGDEWQTLLFVDGEPVSIDLGDHSLAGSELNERLCEYDKQSSDVYANAIRAIDEFGELSEDEQKARHEELEATIQGIGDCYRQILDENRDNLIPVAFLPTLVQVLDDDEAEEAFNPKYAYSSHPYAQKIKKQLDDYNARMAEIEAAKEKLIGARFIDLEEPDVNGKMHKLSEFVGQGKWVFIDFWASWCGPCRREMPNVVAAYKKYHPKGLEIVGLSFDSDKDAWVQAIADLEMPWIHLSDLKGWQTVASDTYNVKSIPSSLLVDPDGVIVARDLRGDALGAKLAEIFGE